MRNLLVESCEITQSMDDSMLSNKFHSKDGATTLQCCVYGEINIQNQPKTPGEADERYL